MVETKPTPSTPRRQGLTQLIATWRRRAEYCRAQAARSRADGLDGEAFRFDEEAAIYERIVEEAAPVAEASDG